MCACVDPIQGANGFGKWINCICIVCACVCARAHALKPTCSCKIHYSPSLWAVAEKSLQRVNWLSHSTHWKQTSTFTILIYKSLMNCDSLIRLLITTGCWLTVLKRPCPHCFSRCRILILRPQTMNHKLAIAANAKFEHISHLSSPNHL